MHLRADDGIRTRDPHLGKVMRYQLRYIRTPRTRSSPGAKHDDSPPERNRTNSSVTMGAPRFDRMQHVQLRRRLVLTFDVVRLSASGLVAQWKSARLTRGRSLVRTQPGPPPTNTDIDLSAREMCTNGVNIRRNPCTT